MWKLTACRRVLGSFRSQVITPVGTLDDTGVTDDHEESAVETGRTPVFFRIAFGALMLWQVWRFFDGGWMDDVIVHNKPLCRDGFVEVPNEAGLGIELNHDVVKAHLAPGETWWG